MADQSADSGRLLSAAQRRSLIAQIAEVLRPDVQCPVHAATTGVNMTLAALMRQNDSSLPPDFERHLAQAIAEEENPSGC